MIFAAKTNARRSRRYARRRGGVIVSNDLFRDAVDKVPMHQRGAMVDWLRRHVLSFTFVGDEFAPNPDFVFPVGAVSIQTRPGAI